MITLRTLRFFFLAMRKTLLHSAALIILFGMVGGQITELFDRWDPPMHPERDVDYTVVLVAACLGVVFIIGKKLISLSRGLLAPLQWAELASRVLFGFPCASPEPLATGPPAANLSQLRI